MSSESTPTPKEPPRVVISSVTGKPMTLPKPKERVIPNRASADRGQESNDERLQRDVPPHWGR